MKHSFIKNIFISAWVVALTAWAATFAQTNIQTNILNAVQTIMKTVYTTNGSANGWVLAAINTGSRIYLSGGILSSATGVAGLGLDANGYVTTNVSLGGWQQWATGPQGPQWPQGATGASVVQGTDDDWYSVTSPWNAPLNINEDIYTYGQVGIWMQNPTVPLQVAGNVIFGNTGNIILWWLYSSILWGINNILNWSYATIVWGENNMSEWPFSTIVWWQSNIISGGAFDWFIGAWLTNTLENSMAWVIGWGVSNRILFNITSFIGGWQWNLIIWAMGSGKENNWIVWWFNNTIKDSNFSFIGWWHLNAITGNNNVIWWWLQNNIQATLMWRSTIAWWDSNTVNGDFSTIWWGLDNIIENGEYNFIGGGYTNQIYNWNTSSIIGSFNGITWSNNLALGATNTIDGWNQNQILWQQNTTTASNSTIIGFENNMTNWDRNFILWRTNIINWSNNLAIWFNANIIGNNIWAINMDSINTLNASQDNSFIINAPSGVGINTNTPQKALHVSGAMVSSQTSWIDGSGISIDAQEVNSFTTTRGSDITIQGIQNWVQGQVVHIAKAHTGYSLTLDNDSMQLTNQLLVGATSPVIGWNEIGWFTLLYDGSQRIVIGRYSN